MQTLPLPLYYNVQVRCYNDNVQVPATSNSCHSCLKEICHPTCECSWLPSLVRRIMLNVVSRVLSTSSSGSLSLSLELNLSTCSLLGDSGGRLASSFELASSLLSFGILSTPFSEFKLTGFKTVSVLYKFRGKVPFVV